MQIVTNQFQKEIKDHGDYQFPLLISEEALSSYEAGSFMWHWHPEIELTLVHKGEMLYQVNDRSFHLHEGDGLFNNTGVLHSGRMQDANDCRYTSVTFDPKLIYGYDNSIVWHKYVEPILNNHSLPAVFFDGTEAGQREVIELMRQIIQFGHQKDDAWELNVLILLQKLWQSVYLYGRALPELSEYDQKNQDRIRSILSFIERNYSSKICLKDIADHIHLCKSECCRLFKRYMNIPLFEFLLRYRIEKSLIYLRNSNYSVAEAAAEVGFNDSNYYTKTFSKVMGCTPSLYRKRLKSPAETP